MKEKKVRTPHPNVPRFKTSFYIDIETKNRLSYLASIYKMSMGEVISFLAKNHNPLILKKRGGERG